MAKDPEESHLSAAFLEGMLVDFLRDPSSVPPDWEAYLGEAGDGFSESSLPIPSERETRQERRRPGDVLLQERVDRLILAYRSSGHRAARIDPLLGGGEDVAELEPASVGIEPGDLERSVFLRVRGRSMRWTVREVLEMLHRTYCGAIGVELMHLSDPTERQWLVTRLESNERPAMQREVQLRILRRLTEAVLFEEFIQKKYLGAKSFSLEGAESLLPLLDLGIEKAASHGVDEVVIGMAHRGRLNVLANLLQKRPEAIFREFEDREPRRQRGRGDVRYHLGHSSDWTTAAGDTVHLSLSFNPSHLEFINPVVLGRVRAKQDRANDRRRQRKLALLIHGDAALAAQGIVQESLNFSQLEGYRVGGALHVVVNNQIGFTTTPQEGRSSEYATGVARMIDAPIFHVNGEDPEAVACAVEVAMEFRREFARDVFVDMYCYRLRGHNEGDEPSFTQPLLYRLIEDRPSLRRSYLERLLRLGQVSEKEAETLADQSREGLESALEKARQRPVLLSSSTLAGVWAGYHGGPEDRAEEVDTTVEKGRLQRLLEATIRTPPGFHLHPKLERGFQRRRQMAAGERRLDWAAGEALALGSLAVEGIPVRLTGQDSERGTFGHRHSVLHDVENARAWSPLSHLADDQATVEIRNSPLSEAGAMGFEYGYSLDRPDALVLWEAQFGDFANAAQVIIDQFLTSAEDKWERLSGLVLLLPHGFEGQGPEHSSARLERWLQLAAEDNIQIAAPTTPAQLFHLLRRQVLRPYRKPLVVMSPKSLLRHRRATSALEELAEGGFQRVLADARSDPPPAARVLLCSGKIYYDLVEHCESLGREDVAVLRIEQLYPWPREELISALARYPDGTPVRWVQEEPANQGAWPYVERLFCGEMFDRLPFRGLTRPQSASPATGSHAAHELEQSELVDAAFGGDPSSKEA